MNTLVLLYRPTGLLSTLAILAVLCLASLPAIAGKHSFVLVHGAHVGAWYWGPVAEGLRSKGHRVIVPDLKGHGTRAAHNSASLTLEEHIEDVVEAIASSPDPVVLVSHSYGGRPATGAWDRMRNHIKAVVFLEAMAPYGQGENALQFDHIQRMALVNLFPNAIETGLLDAPGYLQKRYPEQVLVPQSIEALHAPVPLKKGLLPDTPGAYVIGTNSNARIFRSYAKKVSDERKWTIWEIETGHDMVHDNSDVVIRLLVKLADELPD